MRARSPLESRRNSFSEDGSWGGGGGGGVLRSHHVLTGLPSYEMVDSYGPQHQFTTSAAVEAEARQEHSDMFETKKVVASSEMQAARRQVRSGGGWGGGGGACG